jgi:glycosyltransferase involved in cell wall biosynthesis
MIRNEQWRGAAASRNRGASIAQGDILGFLDDDARVYADWFEIGHRHLKPSLGAITGRVVGFDQGVVARARQYRYEKRYQEISSGEKVQFLAGGNSWVWREIFLKAGGFPEWQVCSDTGLVGRMDELGKYCHFVHDLAIFLTP